MAPARRRLSPRARRTAEIIALAVLLPLLLGLHWYDDRTAVRNGIKRPEAVTVVARGRTATLNRVQWTMLGRDVRPDSSTTRQVPGAARLKLLITVRALDAQAAKDLARARMMFRIRDRDGHIWSASAQLPENIAAGSAVPVPVTATVPPDRLTSVVLEIAQTRNSVPKGPLAVLRFAH